MEKLTDLVAPLLETQRANEICSHRLSVWLGIRKIIDRVNSNAVAA